MFITRQLLPNAEATISGRIITDANTGVQAHLTLATHTRGAAERPQWRERTVLMRDNRIIKVKQHNLQRYLMPSVGGCLLPIRNT